MELEYKDHLSPMLKGDIKNYLIDIDGTITDDVPNEEPERMITCEPYPDALETINRWYDQGHIICFFTSRTEDLKQITIDWLDKHGFTRSRLVVYNTLYTAFHGRSHGHNQSAVAQRRRNVLLHQTLALRCMQYII